MSQSTVNDTEEFVLRICKKTCLSLWACNNPFAEQGKELCDVLVVCDPHTIIISVKSIILHADKELAGHQRWTRKAVDASVRQIYGAERNLVNTVNITFNDGAQGLTLPPLARRTTHRIAVAFGSKGQVPIQSGDFGKGFVHVMHEQSFSEVLSELDTITDLINYLTAKEDLAARSAVVVEASEANLLGWYLFHNRSFPGGSDVMVVNDNIWFQLQEKPEWKRRKEADEPSYVWDKLIGMLSDPKAKSLAGPPPQLTDLELALRTMALETRLARRILGHATREFLGEAKAKKLRSRAMLSPSGVIYVFVYFNSADELQNRATELALRCVAARKKVGKGDVVIGVGIGEHEPGKGSTSDLAYFRPEDWSLFIQQSESALEVFAFFSKAMVHNSHEEEYPKP